MPPKSFRRTGLAGYPASSSRTRSSGTHVCSAASIRASPPRYASQLAPRVRARLPGALERGHGTVVGDRVTVWFARAGHWWIRWPDGRTEKAMEVALTDAETEIKDDAWLDLPGGPRGIIHGTLVGYS